MKRLILSILAAVMLLPSLKAVEIGREAFDGLTADNHPRLLFKKSDFDNLHKYVAENRYFRLMHENFARMANGTRMGDGMSAVPLKYEKDATGKRLKWHSAAVSRILSDAYMYRYTGDKKYLEHVEWDINALCDLPDWNPGHYLDNAHHALAVGVAYDWLYDVLSPDIKAKAEKAIVEFAFRPTGTRYAWFYKRDGNWNQVCNGGLVSAALAIYETAPDVCFDIIEKGVTTNMRAARNIYGPDGIFPEGPGYWLYGTQFEVLLIQMLESAVGTDFGLGDVPGFNLTPYFLLFSTGPTGLTFNFGDNSTKLGACPPLWFFARRYGDNSIIYREIDKLQGSYRQYLLFSALYEAMRIEGEVKPMAERHLFAGSGNTPLVMARTGWGKDDLFFGLKGGTGGFLHGHLDVGEVVYDAHGVRWVGDIEKPTYQSVEKPLVRLGGSYWKMTQGSARWLLLFTNNRWHSTLTVNDRDHCCDGKGELVGSFEKPGSVGGSMDITPVFFDDLKSAVRTCSIEENSYLQITDAIRTRDDRGAHIRFSLVTKAAPTVTKKGIRLSLEGKTAFVSTKGAKVKYKMWSANPKDYPERQTYPFESGHEEYCVVGYEVDIPSGKAVSLITTVTH